MELNPILFFKKGLIRILISGSHLPFCLLYVNLTLSDP